MSNLPYPVRAVHRSKSHRRQLTLISCDRTANVRVGTATAASFLKARARRSRRFLDALVSTHGAPPRSGAVEAGAMASSMVGDFIATCLATTLEDEEFHSATMSVLAVDVRATLDGIFANLAAAARQSAQPTSAQMALETTTNWLRVLAAIFQRHTDEGPRAAKRLRKSSRGDSDTVNTGSIFANALAERHLVTLVFVAGWETPATMRRQNSVDYRLVSRTSWAVVNAAQIGVLRSCRSLVLARCRGMHGGFDFSLPQRAYLALSAVLSGRLDDDGANDDARDVAELCASFLGLNFSDAKVLNPLPRQLARLLVDILSSSRCDAAARAVAPALFAAVEQQPVVNETIVNLTRRARRCDLLRLAFDTTALSASGLTRLQDDDGLGDYRFDDDEEREIDIADYFLLDSRCPKRLLDANSSLSPLARLACGRASTLRPAIAALMSTSAHLDTDASGSLAVAAFKLLLRLPIPGDSDFPTCEANDSIHGLAIAAQLAVGHDDSVRVAAGMTALMTILSGILTANAETVSTNSNLWLLPAAVEALAVTLAGVNIVHPTDGNRTLFLDRINEAIRELSRRHDFIVQRALQGQLYDAESEADAKLALVLLQQLAVHRRGSSKEVEVAGYMQRFATIALNDSEDGHCEKTCGHFQSIFGEAAAQLRNRLAARGVDAMQFLAAVKSNESMHYRRTGIQHSVRVEDIICMHASFQRGSANDVAATLASRRALDALARCAGAVANSGASCAPAPASLSLDAPDDSWMLHCVSTVHAAFVEPPNEIPEASQHAWDVARTTAILDLEAWTSRATHPLIGAVARFYGELSHLGAMSCSEAARPLSWALRRCISDSGRTAYTSANRGDQEGDIGDVETAVNVVDTSEARIASANLDPVVLACKASSAFVAALVSSRKSSTMDDGFHDVSALPDLVLKCENIAAVCRTAVIMAGVDAMGVLLSVSRGREGSQACALAAVACCDKSSSIADAMDVVLMAMRHESTPFYEGITPKNSQLSAASRLAFALARHEENASGFTSEMASLSRQARAVILGSLLSTTQHDVDNYRLLEALLVLATVLEPDDQAIATTLYTLTTRSADDSTRLVTQACALELATAILLGVQRGLACAEIGDASWFRYEPSTVSSSRPGVASNGEVNESTTQQSQKRQDEVGENDTISTSICTYGPESDSHEFLFVERDKRLVGLLDLVANSWSSTGTIAIPADW